MKKYEMLYIISAKQTEEQREALIAKVQKMVEDRNGSVENIDKWGMKKLAYPIQFQNEGFYVLMNFEVDPLEIRGLENALNIIEPIVRKMIVSKN
ncbi:MAG: 30S ribosomal protein S6 [Clostridia bacterium]|nr:30S ribosomal protein S6 [Clostridia bacterium]